MIMEHTLRILESLGRIRFHMFLCGRFVSSPFAIALLRLMFGPLPELKVDRRILPRGDSLNAFWAVSLPVLQVQAGAYNLGV